MSDSIDMTKMLDLALGNQQVGPWNVNILHTLLKAIIEKLELSDSQVKLSGKTGRFVNKLMRCQAAEPVLTISQHHIIKNNISNTRQELEKGSYLSLDDTSSELSAGPDTRIRARGGACGHLHSKGCSAAKEPNEGDKQKSRTSKKQIERDNKRDSGASQKPTEGDKRKSTDGKEPTETDKRESSASQKPTEGDKRKSTSSKEPTETDKRESSASKEQDKSDKRKSGTSKKKTEQHKRESSTNKEPIEDGNLKNGTDIEKTEGDNKRKSSPAKEKKKHDKRESGSSKEQDESDKRKSSSSKEETERDKRGSGASKEQTVLGKGKRGKDKELAEPDKRESVASKEHTEREKRKSSTSKAKTECDEPVNCTSKEQSESDGSSSSSEDSDSDEQESSSCSESMESLKEGDCVRKKIIGCTAKGGDAETDAAEELDGSIEEKTDLEIRLTTLEMHVKCLMEHADVECEEDVNTPTPSIIIPKKPAEDKNLKDTMSIALQEYVTYEKEKACMKESNDLPFPRRRVRMSTSERMMIRAIKRRKLYDGGQHADQQHIRLCGGAHTITTAPQRVTYFGHFPAICHPEDFILKTKVPRVKVYRCRKLDDDAELPKSANPKNYGFNTDTFRGPNEYKEECIT